MKVAICSSDGIKVDTHFGKTSTFYIYNIENGVKTFIEKRNIENYSPTDKFLKESEDTHMFNPDKFNSVYKIISDCEKLYTSSIGVTPQQNFESKGVKVQICNCPIDLIPTCDGKCK